MVKVIAAGLYKDSPAPKTGDWILAWFDEMPNNPHKFKYTPFVVHWESEKWMVQAGYACVSFTEEPRCWAMIYPPKELL